MSTFVNQETLTLNEQQQSVTAPNEEHSELNPGRIVEVGMGFWAAKTLLSAVPVPDPRTKTAYQVPIARLAAAQVSLKDNRGSGTSG